MSSLRSPFKSPKGEAEFLAAYAALMQRWPVPYEAIDLPGRFGRTHLVVSGPQDAPALVLLHGYLATLTMWSANIAALSRDYRVYDVDVMGQPSQSIPGQPIGSRADFVAWLTGILDALQIDRTYLVGMSYGGWLTLNFAVSAPQRVNKIAVLSPAGSFLPNGRQFTLRAMLNLVFPWRLVMDSFVRWLTYKENLQDREIARFTEYMVDLMYLGMKHFRMPAETLQVQPLPFTDDELHSLQAPTLLLIGQQEVLYKAAAALARAQWLIPHFEGKLVARASHDMSYSQHQVVDARVLAFFQERPTTVRPPDRVVSMPKMVQKTPIRA